MTSDDDSSPHVVIDALERGLEERPDPITDQESAAVAERIGGFYRACLVHQAEAPATYRAGGEWEAYYRERDSVYAALREERWHDAGDALRMFWRNDLGAIVKQYAKYEALVADAGARAAFADLMARDYVIWKNLFTAEVAELEVPCVGAPWGYFIDDALVAPKAFRYHAMKTQIEELLRGRHSPLVAEIGAGYGGVAYYFMRDNPQATYVDFDLPETLVVAAYALIRSLPERRVLLCADPADLTAGALESHDIVLAPSYCLPVMPDRSADLYLNMFSLSEMPADTIETYITEIGRTCRRYFLHNNMDRAGVVNRGHERIPCSRYPISPDVWRMLYKRYDLFQEKHFGRDGDYRECLYEKI